jgi:hypothetical protein
VAPHATRSLIYLAVGALVFSALCTPFLEQASFIHDDYIHISYLGDETFADIWLRPAFKRVRGYYRPFELTVFKAVMSLTHKPVHFQLVTALLTFLGTVCLYRMVPRAVGGRCHANGPVAGLDFVVLAAAFPMCASTGICLMWIAAGYNDAFVYAFTAMAMYCTILRDGLDDREARPLRNAILGAVIGLLAFFAAASKEHGTLAFLEVYLVTAFFGRQVPAGERPLVTVWNNVRASLIRNWYLVPIAIGYGVLRLGAAGAAAPRSDVPDPISLGRARFLLSITPDAFFDQTVAWPPYVRGIFAFVLAVLLPIHLLRVKRLRAAGAFVYLSGAVFLIPSALVEGHAPNRLLAFALYPLLGLLILGRTWRESAFLSGAAGRAVLFTIALAGSIGLQQSYAARLLESRSLQQEFDRFSYALLPHVGAVVAALEAGRPIEVREFPFFKDNEFFLRAVFFATSGAHVGRPAAQPRRGAPLILANRGDQLAPRVELGGE